MEILMVSIFVVGYLAIALEHNIHVDKSAPALIIGVLCWTVYILMAGGESHEIEAALNHFMGEEIAGVLFFLLGAMTIVELIDAHEGFDIITDRITTHEKIKLLWIISLLTFFLSAALDNLATTIVMVSILRKLVKTKENRIFFVGMVVIAANAGGAWSPIGDVTTTMLWINDKVTVSNIIVKLIVPSLVCLLVPLGIASVGLRGRFQSPDGQGGSGGALRAHQVFFKQAKPIFVTPTEKATIFTVGLAGLIMVPIFKQVTHLPPFMGIFLSLGVLWLVTEILHHDKNEEVKSPISVIGVLRKVDVPSVLFFCGILLAVSALQHSGILAGAATWLDKSVGKLYVIGLLLGVFSAIVDNVPLVAAAMGMYGDTYPTDHVMWEFIAYCAGTGGSALIIGSAAGVAAMGMERIDFFWYVKRISWLALIGYFAGAFTFILLEATVYPMIFGH